MQRGAAIKYKSDKKQDEWHCCGKSFLFHFFKVLIVNGIVS
jgi:hypothetical protein